jgi:DNA-binding Lrp family transcriptional regulator
MSISNSVSEYVATQMNELDLSRLDRRIVLATQSGLPIHERPYDLIAREVEADPELVKQRLQAMLDDGRIRRIGLVPNHYRLGYVANGMSVWDIDDQDAELAGEVVGAMERVSHCYLRPRALPDWPYNLFAMVHGHYHDEVLDKIEEIAELLGDKVRARDTLFSTRILKKTGLRIS